MSVTLMTLVRSIGRHFYNFACFSSITSARVETMSAYSILQFPSSFLLTSNYPTVFTINKVESCNKTASHFSKYIFKKNYQKTLTFLFSSCKVLINTCKR